MCSATARSSTACPCGVEHDVDAPAVARAVLPRHESGLDHPVDQPGHAAGGQRHVGAQLGHGEPALGRAPDVDQHVEEDERDADVLLELAAQAVGQLAVGADDQAHEADAVVVDLAQDAAAAARLTGLSGRGETATGVQFSPAPGHRPSPKWSPFPCRFPQSPRNRLRFLFYLIDKYLYSQI